MHVLVDQPFDLVLDSQPQRQEMEDPGMSLAEVACSNKKIMAAVYSLCVFLSGLSRRPEVAQSLSAIGLDVVSMDRKRGRFLNSHEAAEMGYVTRRRRCLQVSASAHTSKAYVEHSATA